MRYILLMRNLTILLFPVTVISLIVIPVLVMGQLPIQKVHENVEYSQIMKNWELTETKDFNDVKILRMEGENGINHRTNLLYLTSFCEKDGIYGKLAVFNDRNSKELADPSLLTVKIADAENEDVFLEYTLDGSPHYFKQDIWYNYITMDIPEKVTKRFMVIITDRGLHQDFVFFVFGFPEQCYLKNYGK